MTFPAVQIAGVKFHTLRGPLFGGGSLRRAANSCHLSGLTAGQVPALWSGTVWLASCTRHPPKPPAVHLCGHFCPLPASFWPWLLQ